MAEMAIIKALRAITRTMRSTMRLVLGKVRLDRISLRRAYEHAVLRLATRHHMQYVWWDYFSEDDLTDDEGELSPGRVSQISKMDSMFRDAIIAWADKAKEKPTTAIPARSLAAFILGYDIDHSKFNSKGEYCDVCDRHHKSGLSKGLSDYCYNSGGHDGFCMKCGHPDGENKNCSHCYHASIGYPEFPIDKDTSKKIDEAALKAYRAERAETQS